MPNFLSRCFVCQARRDRRLGCAVRDLQRQRLNSRRFSRLDIITLLMGWISATPLLVSLAFIMLGPLTCFASWQPAQALLRSTLPIHIATLVGSVVPLLSRETRRAAVWSAAIALIGILVSGPWMVP